MYEYDFVWTAPESASPVRYPAAGDPDWFVSGFATGEEQLFGTSAVVDETGWRRQGRAVRLRPQLPGLHRWHPADPAQRHHRTGPVGSCAGTAWSPRRRPRCRRHRTGWSSASAPVLRPECRPCSTPGAPRPTWSAHREWSASASTSAAGRPTSTRGLRTSLPMPRPSAARLSRSGFRSPQIRRCGHTPGCGRAGGRRCRDGSMSRQGRSDRTCRRRWAIRSKSRLRP